MDRRSVQKLFYSVAFPAAVIGIVSVVLVFREELWSVFSSVNRFEEWVHQAGPFGPLIFIILQIIQVVIFIIPGGVPQIAGGYLFGVWLGILYSLIGIIAGSVFNFSLGRYLGLPFVHAIFGKKQTEKFDTITYSPKAQFAFFLLFVVPGFPKDALCYIAGLSSIRFFAFMAISMIARFPGIFGSALLGDAAAESRWPMVVFLAVLSIIFLVIGMVFRERFYVIIEHYSGKRARSSPPDDKISIE
ncbi:MAG: TVP38/TMEM64 family protein [Spirochaetales bacterium]|jgi:uncharacterized membrane protein YdjX (TVP38/TMEM64 family)|nr:TVP38/TMEM64 family protein [Spirochaetales bacterium]